MNESQLQIAVANFLVQHYPNVQFHSDFGSGCKLTKGQAIKQMKQNGGRKGWPDMFIAQPQAGVLRYGPVATEYDGKGQIKSISGDITVPETIKFGLFLELKKDGEKILAGPRAKNRFLSIDGNEYKTKHLKEQADVLYELRKRGYAAHFAVGYEEAIKNIVRYLGY